MYVKSKKQSKSLDRPFSAEVLRRAKDIADSYQIIIQAEDGEYYGRGLEMPYVMNDGKTPDQCVKATREALTAAVAYLLESGKAPPPPASEQTRSEQINIRVTTEEKLLLEEAARSRGFRGISDYVRSASLSNLR
ncbi:MAG TPA: type II toxin-antitoxin system HicB family antitoxin [Tepidisphaeraceae bacterium]|nr:type II toxin-antitoxin system HicB family antitoxin [Tepidisphaeraceae bacterium]